MMMHSYKHRSKSSGSALGGIVFSAIVLIGGAVLVYQLMGWFRASNKETVAAKQSAVTLVAEEAGPVVLDGTATITRTDGASAGAVYRRGTSEHAEFNAVLSLPALAPGNSYEVWMVKDGLVDVQSAGTLDVRADGSFAKVFSVVDPAEFRTVVIMVEPNDGMATPSGNIVAQGSF